MVQLFGFGVIGCGAISTAHIESIKKIPHAGLKAVWSRTTDNARAVAEREGCDVELSVADLVAREDIDAVIICTASGFHLEPALEAIEAGKHVLVEKPIEVTVEKSLRMIEAAEAKGVALGVIFQGRFARANSELYEAVNDGRFGRPVLGNAYVKWYRDQQYYDSGAWRGTWEMDGGGALMNQAIHAVDLLLWMMGPVKSVSAHAAMLAHEGIEVEDTVTATLQFESGALGTIEATTSVWPGYARRLEIHGDKGGAVLEDDAAIAWFENGSAEPASDRLEELGPKAKSGTSRDPMAMSFDNHQAQIEDFIEAAKNGTKPAIDGRDGLRSVELIRAIYRSAETGEVIKF